MATAKRAAGVRPVFNNDATDFKAVQAQLMNAFETFKAEHNEQLKEIKKGYADVVKADKVDRINNALDDLQNVVDQQNAKLAAIMLNPPAKDDDAKAKAYGKAFDLFARKGREADIRAAMSTDSDPDGGYMVPDTMEKQIDRIVTTVNSMRRLATVRQISGGALQLPTTVSGASAGWTTERAARVETDTPVINIARYDTNELYALPYVTQQILDDADFNVESYLADEVGVAFADKEGAAFIAGTGNGQPMGFRSYTLVANASWAYGKIGYVVTGHASAFHATTPADCFYDAIGATKDRYLGNANWLMNRTTRTAIRKFKDGQSNYLWQPSAVAGQPSTFLGYNVEIDDNMSDTGANNYSIAFGDFKQGYLIVEKMGTRVMRDPFTNKPYVGFYTTKRVGGGVKNFDAIKLIKHST